MQISELPDRQWIEREYLPALDGRVLYVGWGRKPASEGAGP